MKQKMILTQGCPGSGKSTWAQENCKPYNAVIISRDDIRMSLFGVLRSDYKYSKSSENLVSEVQYSSIKTAVKAGKSVIIADTNLNEKTVAVLKSIADEHELEFEIKRFELPYTKLKARNRMRGTNSVPESVLLSMYSKMHPERYVGDPNLPKAVVFDLDGTLMDNSHRSPFDFFKCDEDAPVPHIVELFKMYQAQGYKVVCVSGRPSGDKNDPTIFSKKTMASLNKADLQPDELFHRHWNDSREDSLVKQDILLNQLAKSYNVVLSVDDRDSVVEMWRRMGIPCLQVNYGDF
ncbi:polynucleotide kinase [Shewanella phage Thanatos-1]|nr:polynucleotide kinase [Shewanella phage Thanatos-1]